MFAAKPHPAFNTTFCGNSPVNFYKILAISHLCLKFLAKAQSRKILKIKAFRLRERWFYTGVLCGNIEGIQMMTKGNEV